MALNGFDGMNALTGNIGALGLGLNFNNFAHGGFNLSCLEPCNPIGLIGPICEIPQPCDIARICDAQPIVINQDIAVPVPVIIRNQTVPIPFLPYCHRTKKGYPKW